MMTERELLRNGTSEYEITIPMGTLPHMRRKNPNENQTGHRGEKPHCVLPEVQEGNGYVYNEWESEGARKCVNIVLILMIQEKYMGTHIMSLEMKWQHLCL